MKRNVKISKKVICAGPSNMKGTPMFKPDTTIVCNLEEQDREMQKDQAYNESDEEYGSGDDIDKKVDDDEFVDIPDATSEPAKPVELETPAPTTVCSPDDCLVDNVSENDGDIILSEDEVPKKLEVKKVYKDALFSPDEGSGDELEGSGEGSGNVTIFDGWGKAGDVDETTDTEEESQSLGDKLLDTLFNVLLSTTKAPETKKDLNLEEEQFIDASVTKEADETTAVPEKANVDESVPVTGSTIKVDINATTIPPSDGVELLDGEPHDHSKTGKVKTDEEDLNDKLAEVSPAKQSKKGMGSYVVLAALLAILATLIVFAAYKGDFCRKKRKRGDVENGTDMKDMQKALLDTGNATQPKVVTNGTMENVPLVEDSIDHEETKRSDVHRTEMEVSRPSNGTLERVDPVKPPRRTNEPSSPDRDSLKNDSSPARTSPVDVTVNNGPSTDVNGPPLSPGAQRVKITLQENPDSVPRTPILITRTMVGENLVKAP
ncbi:hypothetical protein WN55_08859 [Dufourea novaeangliae]|uniref:Uncharacterized protein n=2 Tax=Dufourea novaeangliae TaxID=178035 RepID=A0A154P090_DUFNO|nr:hypothetical protein WN55_08859 [Dufourea novaeangliae]